MWRPYRDKHGEWNYAYECLEDPISLLDAYINNGWQIMKKRIMLAIGLSFLLLMAFSVEGCLSNGNNSKASKGLSEVILVVGYNSNFTSGDGPDLYHGYINTSSQSREIFQHQVAGTFVHPHLYIIALDPSIKDFVHVWIEKKDGDQGLILFASIVERNGTILKTGVLDQPIGVLNLSWDE